MVPNGLSIIACSIIIGSIPIIATILNIARWSSGLGRLVFNQKNIGSNPIRVTLVTKGQVVIGEGNFNEDNEIMVKLLPGASSVYTH